jgi:hypothetical protein
LADFSLQSVVAPVLWRQEGCNNLLNSARYPLDDFAAQEEQTEKAAARLTTASRLL